MKKFTVEVPTLPEPEPAGMVPQETEPSDPVWRAWLLVARQLTMFVSLIDEVKAALVEVIEVRVRVPPVALLKLNNPVRLRLVEVTFCTTMLTPVIEERLALVEVMFEARMLVEVTMVPEAVVKFRLPVKVPPLSGK